MAEAARLAWDGLLDFLYPPRCLVCEEHARPALCNSCTACFTPVPTPACPVCGRPVEGSSPCRLCAGMPTGGGGDWAFASARAAAIYEGPLRHAIHRFKYGRMILLGEPLGAFLANRLVVDGLLGEAVDAVVPVPIHPVRQRERGFNQTELLAAPVAAMLSVPLLPRALRRVRRTPPQVGLPPEARRANLQDAIAAPEPKLLAGCRVLLVDDVFTTGTTTDTCARSLKEAGAACVYVATLAAGG